MLGRESPCRASLYGKKAGEGKLVGQGELLPSKLIRKEGRGEKASWAGKPGAAPLRIVQIVSWWSY